MSINESTVKEAVREWFEALGYAVAHGPHLPPGEIEPQRESYSDLVLVVGPSEAITEHPVDLSKTLQHLPQMGVLESTGGRGAVYHLPGDAIPTPDDVFGPPSRRSMEPPSKLGSSSLYLPPSSSHLPSSSSLLPPSSSLLEPNIQNLGALSGPETVTRDAEGRLISDQLPLPVIDDLAALASDFRLKLENLASLPRQKAKIDRNSLTEVLLNLCKGHFITLQCMAELVNRQPVPLRNQYLTKLARARQLSLAFPTTPTHERQAYCSTSSLPH